MIRKAKFENFKGLRDVEVTFDSRFTVLVGPNGTGKTSVLEGVEVSAEGFRGSPTDLLMPFLSRKQTLPVKITLLDEKLTGHQIEFPEDPAFRGGIRVIHNGSEIKPPADEQIKLAKFGPVSRPRFVSEAISAPVVTQQTPPHVAVDGNGMTALLAYLKLRDDELFFRSEAELRKVVPSIQKIRVDEIPYEVNGAAAKVFLFDSQLATHIPSSHMSDGTLYILALIVAVLGPHRPKTLLIDDIDMRLHPKAQYELVTLLKKFLDEFPDLQIIATSHSPYILDKLEPNEVRVTGLGDDGSVVIAPLTDHPAYEKWKDSMSPGEFWSHTGEEWLKNHKRSAPTP